MAKATTGAKTTKKAATKQAATKQAATKTTSAKTSAKAKATGSAKPVAKAAAKPAKALSNAELMKIAKAEASKPAAGKSVASKTVAGKAVAAKSGSSASRALPKASAARTSKRKAAAVDPSVAVKQHALAAAQFAIEKKAENVRLLELKDVTSITDYFVVCSAETDRQVKAIAENVIVEMRDNIGQQPWRSEGWDTLRWVIIDFVDFVVHVLQSEAREYYNIERLWADAPSELVEDTASKPKRATRKKTSSDDAAAAPAKRSKIRVIEDIDAE